MKPTPGIGEERVRNRQAQTRKIPPSSTGVRLPRSGAVVFRGRLWQTGQEIGISVGTALAVLEDNVL